MNTTPTENKQLIGRYLQALSGQRKTVEIVAGFVSDTGLDAHNKHVDAAFPEYELVAEELIAERDLAGIAATGRPVSAGLMITYRIEGGRIAQHWMQFDMATLMAQLTESTATRA